MRPYHLPFSIMPVLTFVAIALSVFTIAACKQRSLSQGVNEIPCNEITGDDLAKLFVISKEKEDLVTKLTSEVDRTIEIVTQPEIVVNGQPHESTVYKWQTVYANYSLTTYDRMPLFAVSVYNNKAPSLGHIVDCLGPPSHYIARYGLLGPDASKPSIRIEFFYEDKGVYYFIEIRDNRASRTNTTKFKINEELGNEALNTSTPVRAIQWTLPSDIALMRWRLLYGKPQPTSEDEENRLAMYKVDAAVLPWPGTIRDLEITHIYPELLTPMSK